MKIRPFTAIGLLTTLICFGCPALPTAAQNADREERARERATGRPKGAPKERGKGKSRGSRFVDRFASEYPVVYQDLWIPPMLEGNTLDLTLDEASKVFWEPTETKTFAYNGADFWGPTLILKKGELVQLRVRNLLDEETTVHWHGLHLPPTEDGGPHQVIRPGDTLSSVFEVNNNAATYWYHPHPHEATQDQMTYGAGGLIIIRDEIESRLNLPRTYGVDDIPVVFTSRRFYDDDQFSFEGDDDKYGDYLLTNGDFHAQVDLPAQIVRLRLLNAEIERGYVIGLSDDRPFHLIATDGGLVDSTIELERMILSVGERVEILLDLRDEKVGTSFELMAYNSGQPFGFPGAEPGKGGTNGSLLNNMDFPIMRINVVERTDEPVLEIPSELTDNQFWTEDEVDRHREISINKIRAGTTFQFDRVGFDMDVVNHVVKLDDVEAWTIHNPVFGHAFHIHDVQFKIVARSDGPVPPWEQGWKDTCYIPLGESVTFVTKFENYASDTVPYMYHCHMANHEDEGLMGQFLVSENPDALVRDADGTVSIARQMTPEMAGRAKVMAGVPSPTFVESDLDGNPLSLHSLTNDQALLLYFIESSCLCSREAIPFLETMRDQFDGALNLIGVLNAEQAVAESWVRRSGATFPVISDPDCSMIRKFGAEAAAYTSVVSPAGEILKTFPGYNAESLEEISELVAGALGRETPDISFASASTELVVGCPIEPAPGFEDESCLAEDGKLEFAAEPVGRPSELASAEQTESAPGILATSGYSADQAPHIVIFISDDMGWNDVSYHGSQIETPNIDRLAEEGVQLDRFYVFPICSPTRTALMTSRSPLRFGITGPLTGERGVPADERFFSEAFQASGYQTALVGKWHLGPGTGEFSPNNRGFSYFYGFRSGMIDYYSHEAPGGRDWWRNDDPLVEEGYSTTLIGKEAARVIEKCDKSKRLLLIVPFNAPHGPHRAPQDLITKYEQKLGARRAVFAACVDAMDQEIGRVLGALENEGMAENSLVMFFCDNGGKGTSSVPDGLALQGGKSSLQEGGIRVPCVMRWPAQIPAGQISDQMISVLDLAPSLAAASGVELETSAPLDGVNMWSAISTGEDLERSPFAISGGRGSYAVLHDPYKLIKDSEGCRLYDIREDPEERNDISEQHPEVVAALEKSWEPFAGLSQKGKGKGKTKGKKKSRN